MSFDKLEKEQITFDEDIVSYVNQLVYMSLTATYEIANICASIASVVYLR